MFILTRMNKQDLKEWIASELEARNWSMRELARRANISHSWISNVLAGQPPTWDFCAAIAAPLGASPVEVLLRAELVTATDIRRANRLLSDEPAGITERLVALVAGMPEEEQRALFRILAHSDADA
jgi:transcriptional regulator with XRE-family HTH domain